MNTGFPTHTVAVILATMIASGIGVWALFAYGLKQAGVRQGARRGWLVALAVLLVVWFGGRLLLAVTPPQVSGLAAQFQITLVSLALGLLAGLLPLAVSPTFRQVVRAIPETWIVGLHAIRLEGFLFLALLDMGRLPPQFALSAGYGDMLTGLLALGLVYLLGKRKSYARGLVIGWNALGLLDFVSAIVTGGIFIVPFAIQLAGAGISLGYLNFVLIIPAFGVPMYAVLHIYSLYQMLTGRETRRAGAAALALER